MTNSQLSIDLHCHPMRFSEAESSYTGGEFRSSERPGSPLVRMPHLMQSCGGEKYQSVDYGLYRFTGLIYKYTKNYSLFFLSFIPDCKYIAKCRGHVAGSADKVAGVPFSWTSKQLNQLDFNLTLLFWFPRSNAGDLTVADLLVWYHGRFTPYPAE